MQKAGFIVFIGGYSIPKQKAGEAALERRSIGGAIGVLEGGIECLREIAPWCLGVSHTRDERQETVGADATHPKSNIKWVQSVLFILAVVYHTHREAGTYVLPATLRA